MIDISLAALAAQVFTGLVLGMIFVLLAIGLSLIFGLMTVVNFSHGAFYMLGAYFGFFLFGFTKNFWVSLLIAPLGPLTAGLLLSAVSARMTIAVFAAFGLVLALWGTLSATIRNAPSLDELDALPARGAAPTAVG